MPVVQPMEPSLPFFPGVLAICGATIEASLIDAGVVVCVCLVHVLEPHMGAVKGLLMAMQFFFQAGTRLRAPLAAR